jgi:hypothetical protein
MTRNIKVKVIKEKVIKLPTIESDSIDYILFCANQYSKYRNDAKACQRICRNLSNLLNDNTVNKYYRIDPIAIEPITPKIIVGSKKPGTMPEHVVGRQYSAELIIEYINNNNITMLNGAEVIELFKKFSPVLEIRKNGNDHTKLNYELQTIQRRGKLSFDAYNNILEQCGYNKVNEQYRQIFPNV